MSDRPLHWTRSATALLLVPGEYDIYWVQDNDNSGNPLRLAAGVKVDSGQVPSVRADSGVKLEVASWVPQRNGSYGWWGAVRDGDRASVGAGRLRRLLGAGQRQQR